jgi:hypothetical protein
MSANLSGPNRNSSETEPQSGRREENQIYVGFPQKIYSILFSCIVGRKMFLVSLPAHWKVFSLHDCVDLSLTVKHGVARIPFVVQSSAGEREGIIVESVEIYFATNIHDFR